jgi:hypothetical protein
MSDVEDPVSVAEAARRLGISTEKAYELVFARQLDSTETPTGRRVVPIAAIARWRDTHPVSA